jgi:hypothetical protein
MHWIQAKKSHEDAQPVIKVKVVADGRAEIEGDDLKLTPGITTLATSVRRSAWAAAPNGGRSITCCT